MLKNNKRIIWLLVVALMASVALTACGGGDEPKDDAAVETDGDDAGEVAEDEVLVVAQGADAPSLDPHATNDSISGNINGQMYSKLVNFNTDMEVEPDVAEEWEQIDDVTWEFTIRDDVKFHNGEDLTVEDVKFSLDRHVESPSVAHTLEAVDHVDIIDENTIQIVTKEPFAALLAHLNHTSVMMLNEKAVEEGGEDYGQDPVGSGPFKFVDWTSGDTITLERFDDYFGDAPKLAGIEFKNIPEATNRAINLETGEIDFAFDIEPVDKATIEADPNLTYLEGPGFGIDYIGFNVEKEPFDDVLVRRAINHAINRDEIVDVIMQGTAVTAIGPLQEDSFGAATDLEMYEYDPEKAKELLAEAGYPDGFETSVSVNEGQRVDIAEMVQAQLKDVGIELKVDILEWGAYLDATGRGDHEMFILGWTNSTGDAENGLSSTYLTENHGDGGNRMFYSNPEVDDLIKRARAEIEPEDRIELYHEAQEKIVEDAPNVLLKHNLYTFGFANYVKGFECHPSGSQKFRDVYIDRTE